MPGPGRNQPCPCGSGRKTKHCCGQQRGPPDKRLARAHVALLARQAIPDLAGLSDRALDHLWASKSFFNITLHGVGQPPRTLDPGEEAVWLSASAAKSVLREARSRPEVRITLDDGNRSDVGLVLDELQRHRLTATFFVVAGRIGKEGFLDEDDLRAIATAGHSLGLHGMSHRPWRGLSAQELDQELIAAREFLQAASGTQITQVSCPFGSYDRAVLKRLRELGYQRVYTSDGGPADPQAWLQPRTTIESFGPRSSIEAITQPPCRSVLVGYAKQAWKRWR